MKVGEATKRDSWVVIPKPNPGPKLRLFCFPYAGGGAYIYRSWSNTLPTLGSLRDTVAHTAGVPTSL